MHKHKPRKAVLYARYSPRPQTRLTTESCEIQLQAMRYYCKAMSWEIIGEFRDDAQTGATLVRDNLEPALQLAMTTKGGVLVIYKLDRLARNVVELWNVTGRLEDARSHLCSISEHIDTTSAMGEFIFTMMGAIAQLERKQTAERISVALKYYISQGRRIGPRPGRGRIFGGKSFDPIQYGRAYDPNDPDRMILNDEEQVNIAVILRLRAEGLGYFSIAKRLNAMGSTYRRGSIWHHGIVARIVKQWGPPEAPTMDVG